MAVDGRRPWRRSSRKACGSARTSRARRASRACPALLVLPGLPARAGRRRRRRQHRTRASCDRIAREAGWAGLTFTFRGTGPSEGDFSIDGWLADVRAAVDALHARTDVTGVWIAGFRLGGTLAIVTAAHDDRVRGIATFSAPASLRTWVRDPAWFLEYARRTGVLRTPDYPPDPGAWIRAIANLDVRRRGAPHRAAPVAARARLATTTSCPVDDARRLADAARRLRRAAHRRRTARTACATTRARSPRSSAGSTARTRRPRRELRQRRVARRRARRASVSAERVLGRPAGAPRAAWRRRRRGAGPRPAARASGSWTSRSGRARVREQRARRSRATETPVPEQTL